MIPQTDTATLEQGNIQGESIALGVSSDISHIMSVLTRLYSDEATAVIREYSTNAYDEHVEAGVTRPIEVTTPTALAPFLTIRDYGRGLSLDDLRAVYSQYGESTKRGSNAVTGMLGLGCKSGLAYAPSFNIVSVSNGIKVNAQMKRNVEGGGEIKIVGDPAPSDEPSGVTIKIPARDAWSLQRKAANFFRFWPEGSVLVDGKEPARLHGVSVTDSALIVDGLDHDYIVMGNVPYPVESRLSEGMPYGKHVVAVVPIGTVKPAPSREALIYNEQTNVAIAAIQQQIKDAMVAAALKAVASAKTHADALRAANEWRDIVNRTYQWRGLDVPTQFKAEHWVWRPNRGRYATSSDSIFYCGKNDRMEKLEKTVLIHNFVGKDGNAYDEMTSTHRKKIRDYYESKLSEPLPSTIVVSETEIGSPWLDGIVTRVDYAAEILPYRKPRDPNKVKSVMGKQPINVFDRGLGYFVEAADDYEWEGPFILTTPADDEFPASAVLNCLPEYTVVQLGRGRYNKFERLFGEDTEVIREYDFWTVFDARKQGVVDALTTDDRILLAPPREDVKFANHMRPVLDNLLDAEVRDYLRMLNGATMTKAGKLYQSFAALSDWQHSMPKPTPIDTVSFWQRYPLLSDLAGNSYYGIKSPSQNLLDYMNGLALLNNRKGK